MSAYRHNMTQQQFDIACMGKYKAKLADARSRSLEFSLTFNEFRSILQRKHCAYTGRLLKFSTTGPANANDISIERVDNQYGYVAGNCIAICHAANQVKGVFENPTGKFPVEEAIKMFANLEKIQKKMKQKS